MMATYANAFPIAPKESPKVGPAPPKARQALYRQDIMAVNPVADPTPKEKSNQVNLNHTQLDFMQKIRGMGIKVSARQKLDRMPNDK